MANRKAMLDGIIRQVCSKLFLQNLVCFLLLDLFILVFVGVSG